jgi:hypothetical protein
MKPSVYGIFLLVLLAGFGCAITDYGVINDNDQGNQALPEPSAPNCEPNCVRGIFGCICPTSTNGPAHIKETSQIATIWPDGTDELINFVDQKVDGTATLTTYNNFSTGGEPTFHDDLYCNPSWVGCSIFTASDDNDSQLFDGTSNANCSGARSLSILLSTGRYYGECGNQEAKFSVADKVTALSSAIGAERFGRSGLLWNLSSSNTSIVARNLDTGQSYMVPTFGVSLDHFMSEHGNVAFTWLNDALLGPALLNFGGLLDKELRSEAVEVTVTVNGIEAGFMLAGGDNDLVRRNFLLNSRRF